MSPNEAATLECQIVDLKKELERRRRLTRLVIGWLQDAVATESEAQLRVTVKDDTDYLLTVLGL